LTNGFELYIIRKILIYRYVPCWNMGVSMNNRTRIADNIVILSEVILASALGLLIIGPLIVQRSMLRL